MPTTWTYNDWRRQGTNAQKRARLILHIEEVEQALAGFQSQGAAGQSASRYGLEVYLNRLEAKLAELDQLCGADARANVPRFIQARPVRND